MIGDFIVTVNQESNITIMGKHYKGTRRLWELLIRNGVAKNVIMESDLKKDKTIFERTKAHLECL